MQIQQLEAQLLASRCRTTASCPSELLLQRRGAWDEASPTLLRNTAEVTGYVASQQVGVDTGGPASVALQTPLQLVRL